MPAVLAAVKATKASEYVVNLAKSEAQSACAAIAHFADSSYKKAMLELAEFAANRNF